MTNRNHLAQSFQRYQKVFLALGDETRQQIILALLTHETIGMRVPELAQKTRLSHPAVSHHLKILRDAGLIQMHKVGTMHYYYLDANASCWSGLKALVDHINELMLKSAEAGYPIWEQELFTTKGELQDDHS